MTCPISLRIKPVAQGTFQKEGQEVSAVAAQRNRLDVFSDYGYRNKNLEGSVILHSFNKVREIASSFSTYEILNHGFFGHFYIIKHVFLPVNLAHIFIYSTTIPYCMKYIYLLI